jgi:hypothetical protein
MILARVQCLVRCNRFSRCDVDAHLVLIEPLWREPGTRDHVSAHHGVQQHLANMPFATGEYASEPYLRRLSMRQCTVFYSELSSDGWQL